MEGETPHGGVGNTVLGGGEGGEEKSQCFPPPSMKHCKVNICSRLSLIFLASFQVMLSLLLKSPPPLQINGIHRCLPCSYRATVAER